MRWASSHCVPLTVLGGGHSGHCLADGALALWLRHMGGAVADPARGVVVAGGGATMGQVAAAAARYGMAVTTGARPRWVMKLGMGPEVWRLGRGALRQVACALSVGGGVGLPVHQLDTQPSRAGGKGARAMPRCDALWRTMCNVPRPPRIPPCSHPCSVGCGLVLAGGVGHLARAFGLAVDNVVELRCVGAGGQWAACGHRRRLGRGCGNRGI